jgi:hypothetical protein
MSFSGSGGSPSGPWNCCLEVGQVFSCSPHLWKYFDTVSTKQTSGLVFNISSIGSGMDFIKQFTFYADRKVVIFTPFRLLHSTLFLPCTLHPKSILQNSTCTLQPTFQTFVCVNKTKLQFKNKKISLKLINRVTVHVDNLNNTDLFFTITFII